MLRITNKLNDTPWLKGKGFLRTRRFCRKNSVSLRAASISKPRKSGVTKSRFFSRQLTEL